MSFFCTGEFDVLGLRQCIWPMGIYSVHRFCYEPLTILWCLHITIRETVSYFLHAVFALVQITVEPLFEVKNAALSLW